MQDYGQAATIYEQLTNVCPDVQEYKVYHAQSLYKAGMYAEATKSALNVDSSDASGHRGQVLWSPPDVLCSCWRFCVLDAAPASRDQV